MIDSKYVVFKSEDWSLFADAMGEDGVHQGGQFGIYITELSDRMLSDAEVIRHQDITAAPIFHHYASAIETILELAQQVGLNVNEADLRQVADHFHQAAVAAENHPHRKLPD